MRKLLLLLASASLFASTAARADIFDNIQYWVGTGANRAAFEIDWNTGSANEAMIWGYRWDGTATGAQMLGAIVAADPRLYAEVSGTTGYGTAVFGLGFHTSADQNFQLNPTLSFNDQHLSYAASYSAVNDSRAPVTAGDFWREGWYKGYWTYYLSTDTRLTANYSDWTYSGVGMSGRNLTDGAVDGWSFAPGFSTSKPSVPLDITAVPEPSALALTVLAGALFLRRKH